MASLLAGLLTYCWKQVTVPIFAYHRAAEGVRQEESGKKVTKNVTEASVKVTKKATTNEQKEIERLVPTSFCGTLNLCQCICFRKDNMEIERIVILLSRCCAKTSLCNKDKSLDFGLPCYNLPENRRACAEMQSINFVGHTADPQIIIVPISVPIFHGPQKGASGRGHVKKSQKVLSGPVLRARDYLSDTPLLRAMGFLVSQHGQWGAIPPPPFLSVFPPWRACKVEVRYPPPKRGISAILARYPMKTRQTGAILPSAILSRKGIARYGGVSRTGPLRKSVKDIFRHFSTFFEQGKKRRKSSNIFSTLFDTIFPALWGALSLCSDVLFRLINPIFSSSIPQIQTMADDKVRKIETKRDFRMAEVDPNGLLVSSGVGQKSACAPLCCKNMCCASRFCTRGRGAAGSRSKQMSKGP